MFPLWYASLVSLKRTELSRLSGADIDFSVLGSFVLILTVNSEISQ